MHVQCKVGLIDPDSIQLLPSDAKTKARSLLQSIGVKVQGEPVYFHHFLALIKKLPGHGVRVANLGVILQKAYGMTIVAFCRACCESG